jgi:hypothetical protein
VKWWLGEDVLFLGSHWGQRDEWVLGIAWSVWLLVLSIHGTGKGMSPPFTKGTSLTS